MAKVENLSCLWILHDINDTVITRQSDATYNPFYRYLLFIHTLFNNASKIIL